MTSFDFSTEFECDESNFYQKLGSNFKLFTPTCNVSVNTPCGDAEYQLIKSAGAFFVREVYNYIDMPLPDKFATVYLVMVNPEHNNYKFYKLEDNNDGKNVLATYGRIGAGPNEMFGTRTHLYPRNMYYIKLMEKMNKGYQDMTDFYITNDQNKKEKSNELTTSSAKQNDSKNAVSAELYALLKMYSKHYIAKTLRNDVVTEKMVDEAKRLLSNLYDMDTTNGVDEFNKVLLKIMAISPRKVDNVSKLLAVDTSDVSEIISREETLIMAMEAVVQKSPSKSSKTPQETFSAFGIKVFEATEKQRQEVLNHLSDNLKPLVKKIYRVIPTEQKKKFNEYLKTNNIHKVKQLWHGSRNENWLSIINNGLLLKPNAVITGKMLGNGIYFAPSSMKSWGYTSYSGSYWAGGNSDTAFMGLYACAYGTPKNVTLPGNYNQKMLNSEGCNCVHAHAGPYLRNDEIVFYDEAAMLLNYIVEFNK